MTNATALAGLHAGQRDTYKLGAAERAAQMSTHLTKACFISILLPSIYAVWLFFGWPGTICLLVVVLPLSIIVFRITSLELTTLALAVSFYPPLAVKVNLSAADFLAPFLLLAVWRGGGLSRIERNAIAPFRIGALLLVAWVAISLYFVALAELPVSLFSASIELSKLLWVLTLAAMASILITRSLSKADFRFAAIWGWAGAAISCAAVVTGLGLYPILPIDASGRVRGTFEDPNLFAVYLITAMMAATLSRVYRGRSAVGWPHALIVFGVLATGSRGALASLAAALTVYFLLGSAGTKLRLLVLALLSSAVIISSGGLKYLGGVSRLEATSVNATQDTRIGLWTIALEAFQSAPISGIGIGQFPDYDRLANPLGLVAHSTPLSMLAELGLPGLGFALAPFGMVLFASFRTRQSLAISRAWLAGCVALFTMLLTINGQNARFIGFVFATSAAIWALTQPRENPQPHLTVAGRSLRTKGRRPKSSPSHAALRGSHGG